MRLCSVLPKDHLALSPNLSDLTSQILRCHFLFGVQDLLMGRLCIHIAPPFSMQSPSPSYFEIIARKHTGNCLLFLIQNLMNVWCEGWVQVATATLIVLDSLTHSEITLFCSLLAKDSYARKERKIYSQLFGGCLLF